MPAPALRDDEITSSSTIPDAACEPAVLARARGRPCAVLHCADPGSLGRSRTVGLLAVGRPLDPAATEALRFNPWTSGEGIVPVGRLNWLRRLSYASSQ
jgi:hypothetical protein